MERSVLDGEGKQDTFVRTLERGRGGLDGWVDGRGRAGGRRAGRRGARGRESAAGWLALAARRNEEGAAGGTRKQETSETMRGGPYAVEREHEHLGGAWDWGTLSKAAGRARSEGGWRWWLLVDNGGAFVPLALAGLLRSPRSPTGAAFSPPRGQRARPSARPAEPAENERRPRESFRGPPLRLPL